MDLTQPSLFTTISGLVVCFGPLAITIVAFVAFALRTDIGARKTYLRRLDMRTESELPDAALPMVVTETTEALTPSKSRVILQPNNGDGAITTS